MTSRWLERAGRPWLPITGEIHYHRLPRERWSEVLGKARAGGLDTVATYVMWQVHEPQPGEFCWDGDRDLRAFIQLAATHELDVLVRMGPWSHGEARYGGFPDWLVALGLPMRTNDPAYLDLVRTLYSETIAQLAGLTHGDRGPVVAVQIENELYDQPHHLATLRTIAEELGLHVPIWTATGWGGAQVPQTLLPVYSAYADGFWEDSATEWPEFAASHFRYSQVRDDLSVGKDLRETLDGIVLEPGAVPLRDDAALPFATCELGGGMHVAYHRRPLVRPDDVAALALAKIGSGSTWQGYYMYAGGTQRRGPNGTEQESHATGYPNDVPTRTYDFHAPIGEHGQVREHYHQLRRQHLWLQADGPAIATMQAVVGGGSEDPGELRWAVRADGERGYLFLSTYQPARRPLAAQAGVQLTIDFDDATITAPTRPIDIPAGVSMAWPLRYPLTESLTLRSATAQLVTRISDDDGEIVVVSASGGIPVELAFDGDVSVAGTGVTSIGGTAAGGTIVTVDTPGPEAVIELPGVRILVLDESTADRLYRLELGGRDRLVLSDAPIYTRDRELVLHTDSAVTLSFLPAPGALSSVEASVSGTGDHLGLWRRWRIEPQVAGRHRLLSDLTPAGWSVPELRRGGSMNRLSAPTDFSAAARVRVDVPDGLFEGADRVLVQVAWTGDIARAVVGADVVSDHFWHGRVWDIDVTAQRQQIREHGLVLEFLPWHAGAGIWVDPAVRDVPEGVVIDAVDLIQVARVGLAPMG
ncbi:beta-galactosidase [Ruania halotolerans]|uniref:beta-galactosidase n=1 Tax=Ruania halotolerans TaxID=2897773 RepID=UPI003F490810